MTATKSIYIDRSAVPWTLWVYVATTLISVVHVLSRGHPVRLMIFTVAFFFVWNYFLLRGVWWVWIATVASFVLFFAVGLFTGIGAWWSVALGLIQLCLLLLGPSRRFFASPAT